MFIVLSLFTLYLFMMGYASISLVGARGRTLEQVALTLSVGILINYCLMLTGQTITRVSIAGTILALWGGLRFCLDLRTRPANRIAEYKTTVFPVCCITYIVVAYYFTIFSEPLLHWDARSIWFFHAKMIWTEGALRQSAGWNHPSIAFSNPDYPKLVPAIAAQLAYAKGYWNEFLPKGSLLVMLVPLTLWVFSFRQKSVSFVLLVLTFFFSLEVSWLSNGYMDGYLILYSGMALLLFGRYLSETRETDLCSGMCALGIGASLKNEGLLFGLCAIAALLLISPGYPAFSLSRCAKRIRTDSLFVRVLLFSAAPTLMWTIHKKTWGLQSDLAKDPLAGVSRLSNRLFDGSSPQYVLSYLTLQASAIWMVAGLLAIAVMFLVHKKVKVHRGAFLAAATSALYFCGLYVLYLSTPHDILDFYLSTSAFRTMATASVALLVSLFFLLSGLEVHQGAR